MLDKKYERYVFALIMGMPSSTLDGFFLKWMEAFFKAAVCAIPIISVVAPFVKKIVSKVIK